MRHTSFIVAALAACVASARTLQPRSDLDDYVFPQQCQAECNAVVAFRDSCRQNNMEIEDDDDKRNHPCSICNLIQEDRANDCLECLWGVQSPPNDTDDVISDMREAFRECPGVTRPGGAQASGASGSQVVSPTSEPGSPTGGSSPTGATTSVAPGGANPGSGDVASFGISAAAVMAAVMAAVAV